MTHEMFLDLANQRYHHSHQVDRAAAVAEFFAKPPDYTPHEVEMLEYAAWLDQQNDWSPEEYDAMMSELVSNYGGER